jgi:hypothetical protein
VLSLAGNWWRRHRRMRWLAVPLARAWEAQAAFTNASYERFMKDVLLGNGGSGWSTPGSPVQIYDHNGNLVGSDATLPGWYVKGVTSIEPARYDQNGSPVLWTVEWPELTAVG